MHQQKQTTYTLKVLQAQATEYESSLHMNGCNSHDMTFVITKEMCSLCCVHVFVV